MNNVEFYTINTYKNMNFDNNSVWYKQTYLLGINRNAHGNLILNTNNKCMQIEISSQKKFFVEQVTKFCCCSNVKTKEMIQI